MSQLKTSGWVPSQGAPKHWGRSGVLSLPKAKLGLWVFLAVATALFSLIVVAYVVRMGLGDWRPIPVVPLLWLNTILLVLSSVSMQWAQIGSRRGQTRSVKIGLLGGGVFAWAFLAGQLWAWQQLNALGYFVATSPASTFFYLITALHGLHLLGGLVAWTKASIGAWHGDYTQRVRLRIELCAVYWHYLLALWLLLFALILIT